MCFVVFFGVVFLLVCGLFGFFGLILFFFVGVVWFLWGCFGYELVWFFLVFVLLNFFGEFW